MIKNHRVRNVLQELARCLAIFPNVHTLMIKMDHDKMPTFVLDQVINSSFGRYKSFPQIRSIIVPLSCTTLLKYMLGARSVRFIRRRGILGKRGSVTLWLAVLY